MKTEIPNNMTPLPIKSRVNRVNAFTKFQPQETKEILFNQPPFFQKNKLLYIIVLGQISRLTSQLYGYEAQDPSEKTPQQTIIKIIILQLRIKLIQLLLKMQE